MRIDVGDPMFYILTSFNSLVSKSLFCKIIIGECFVCSSSCLWSQLVLAKNNINTFGHRKTTFENGEKEFWLSFVSRYYTHRKQRRCSIKKLFLKMLQSSQQNTCVRVFFFNKVARHSCNFIKKETHGAGFSYKSCEISKYTSYRTPTAAASELTESFWCFFHCIFIPYLL